MFSDRGLTAFFDSQFSHIPFTVSEHFEAPNVRSLPQDMTAPKSLFLRVAVVIFAISLLTGYVIFSQTRATSRVTPASSAEPAPVPGEPKNDKAGIVGFGPAERARSLQEITILSTKSGAPLIQPQSLQLEVGKSDPSSLPIQQPRPVTAPGSKIMFHVVPPSALDSLLQSKPAETTAPGSKGLVPVFPQSAVIREATIQKSTTPRSVPGSKSMVPIFNVRPRANSPAQQQQSR
jgi:hypothetical protein